MDTVTVMDAAIALTFLVAGAVKGVIGFGLPTVAVGVLGALMTPAQAAALMILPSLVTNAWQAAAGGALPELLRRLWPMLVGIFAGTLAAAWLLAGAGKGAATFALGAVLVLYSVGGLVAFGLTIAPRREALLAPLTGALTGALTAATGIFVLPAVPYLQALRLERDALVQALGLSFTASTLALALPLWRDGLLFPALGEASLLALLPALLGMMLGRRLRRWLRPDIFRRSFYGGLLLLGAHLIVTSLWN